MEESPDADSGGDAAPERSADDATDGSAGGDGSIFDQPAGDGPATDSARERFWDFICKFAVYFYILLLMVTVFLVMNVLVLALVPASSLGAEVQTGSLVVIGINLVILLGMALGIVYILRVCDRYTTPAADDEAL